MRAGVRTSSVRVTELYRSATRRTSSAGMLRFQNVQGLCCTAAFAREWQNMSTVRTYSTSVPRPGHFLVAISRQFNYSAPLEKEFVPSHSDPSPYPKDPPWPSEVLETSFGGSQNLRFSGFGGVPNKA